MVFNNWAQTCDPIIYFQAANPRVGGWTWLSSSLQCHANFLLGKKIYSTVNGGKPLMDFHLVQRGVILYMYSCTSSCFLLHELGNATSYKLPSSM